MKKILIVNFTRMGDLLQSTPLIAGLKRKYPASEITLAVMSDFRGICSGFPGVDKLISLDFGLYIGRLRHDSLSIEDHYTYLNKIVRRMSGGYDMVINLSHSNLSAVYCHLSGCEDIRGQMMIREGAVIVRHPWMNYFFDVSRNRLYNTFNLVDMYNMTGDIDMLERKEYYTIPEDAKSFPDEFLKDYQGKFIGFQLGASTEDKRWDPEMFGKVASLIHEKLGWNIIVFGRGGESELLKKMRNTYSGSIIDAIDKTSLPQLAALLKRCELLITNDTGTMHLATAVGTGVVVLDLGEALAADTGPYTEKAVVLEANIPCAPCSFQTTCLDHKCHRFIHPEDVFNAVVNFDDLTTGEIEQYEDSTDMENLILSRPVFEDDGFWYLAPLIKRPLTVDHLLRGLYRRMWKVFLNPERNSHPTEFEKYYSPPKDEDFATKLYDLRQKFAELSDLGSKGMRISRTLMDNIDSPSVGNLRSLTKELIVLDNSIYHLELTVKEIAPIATIFRLNKNNAEHGDLEYIAGMTQRLYSDICRQSQFMIEGIELFAPRFSEIRESVPA